MSVAAVGMILVAAVAGIVPVAACGAEPISAGVLRQFAGHFAAAGFDPAAVIDASHDAVGGPCSSDGVRPVPPATVLLFEPSGRSVTRVLGDHDPQGVDA